MEVFDKVFSAVDHHVFLALSKHSTQTPKSVYCSDYASFPACNPLSCRRSSAVALHNQASSLILFFQNKKQTNNNPGL